MQLVLAALDCAAACLPMSVDDFARILIYLRSRCGVHVLNKSMLLVPFSTRVLALLCLCACVHARMFSGSFVSMPDKFSAAGGYDQSRGRDAGWSSIANICISVSSPIQLDL